MKKLLAFILSFLLILSTCGVVTFATTESVAKVGNTEYATIDDAIANWTNGTTLTLLADVTLSDVIKLSSTENHILDLATYTMTAAKNKDAIQYVVNGRSSMGVALDIKADATNPGGITATGGSVVRHTKPLTGAPSKDRPITRFYGGVFNASYVVRQGGSLGAGYTGASAPAFYFYGGEYNGTIYTNRSINQFYGGTFNGNMQMSVDTSAYTMVAGGTFKNLSNSMGSSLTSDKFTIGSSKGANNGSVCIDENGYYVITTTTPTVAEASVASNYNSNNYFYYSTVNTNGMYYEDVYMALEKNPTATITVYEEELDLEGINFTGTIVVPEGQTLEITNAPEDLKVEGEGEVIIVKPVAMIGDTYYETVQAAINEAKDGDTVQIFAGEFEAINISNKNITIKGTVGENGELLTTIKGGDPAITGHGFNGTIKDLKIVDAWKVMYAEPAGNVTVDNVYVTGATYGFHLVAYSKNLTWTIKNSYMDLSWANSFGVYKDGDAEIIITGNEFAATNPFYPDYGAIPVNSFLPNVTVTENIFRENAKIYIDASVADTSKINVSRNYHADGIENAFADDTDGVKVDIYEYYTSVDENGKLSGLVTVSTGLSGSGTETDPYLINNKEELILFRDSVNAGETKYNAPGVYVALATDIDMEDATWERGIGDGINATFDGIFDGKNFTIENLNFAPKADADGYLCGGLFGYTYGAVTIKDLVLENIKVDASDAVRTGNKDTEPHNIGILVGFANNNGGELTVSNVTVKNIVIDAPYVDGVGAIVGYSYRNMGTIKNCSVDGATIKGYSFVGGITGYSYSKAVITGCSVKNATIIATSKGAGGIAGIVLSGNEISGNTVADTTVTAVSSNWGYVVGQVASEGILINDNTAAEPQVGGSYSSGEAVQAKIGDKYYTTLAAALDAAKADDTIVLLAPIVVNAGETLVLDKAVTITYTSDVAGEDMITNRGTLIIDGATLVYVNTDTTASNVTVSTISCEPGSVLEVKSGVVRNDSAYNANIYAYAIDLLTNGNLGDVTATISGGEVISTNYMAIRQFNNGTACKNILKVENGYIYGAKRAIQVHLENNAAYTTITGGKIEAGEGGYALCLFPTDAENLSVTGGTFIGTIYSGTYGFISGGTFYEEVYSEYVAEGFTCEENSDGTYGIVEEEEEPTLGTKLYYVKGFKPAGGDETGYGFLMTIGIDSLDYKSGGCGFYLTVGGVTKRFVIKNGVVWESLTVELPDKIDYITPDMFGAGNTYIMNHIVYFNESQLETLGSMQVSVQGFVTTFDGVEITTAVFNCGTLVA